ncbi:MAG: dTMP kinase [Anaerolineae bacterium]|nr:dTMP kinase [Anaerolineae bacterium]
MSYFITLEGPEGSGKTTQARPLADYLRARGYDVLLTREPGGTPIGDQVRAVLHDLDNTAMHPRTEILLYSASRAQHVYQAIRPHLARGGVVVSDRYYDSTLAYQGYGHGLDLEALRQITAFATGGLVPDLTLYLDIGADAGLARRRSAAAAGDEWNRMDTHALAFYERVRAGYRALIEAEPARWVTFDAAQPVEELHRQIIKAVERQIHRLEES